MANYFDRIWPNFKELARSKRKENKKFFARLNGQDPKRLNEQFHSMHKEVFAETDCLKCARCCRATGPRENLALFLTARQPRPLGGLAQGAGLSRGGGRAVPRDNLAP